LFVVMAGAATGAIGVVSAARTPDPLPCSPKALRAMSDFPTFSDRLSEARRVAHDKAEAVLLRAKAEHRGVLADREQMIFNDARRDMLALDERLADQREDERRSGHPVLEKLSRGARSVNSAGRLWSAIRRTTNTLGDYYVSADPSAGEVDQAWGIPMLVSSKFTLGQAVLVDSTQYGRVVVREGLGVRIGYAGTDFTDNVVRLLAEERLTQTIERPQAICVIKNMPTTLDVTTTDAKAAPAAKK
jgi:hypothetical protein